MQQMLSIGLFLNNHPWLIYKLQCNKDIVRRFIQPGDPPKDVICRPNVCKSAQVGEGLQKSIFKWGISDKIFSPDVYRIVKNESKYERLIHCFSSLQNWLEHCQE